jgi:hypothetical protein
LVGWSPSSALLLVLVVVADADASVRVVINRIRETQNKPNRRSTNKTNQSVSVRRRQRQHRPRHLTSMQLVTCPTPQTILNSLISHHLLDFSASSDCSPSFATQHRLQQDFAGF